MMLLSLLSLSLAFVGSAAFDNTRFDNTAVYWGQNSYGAGHSNDPANFQRPISAYCNDDAIDVFPVAFLNVFFGPGGLPEINLANTCNPTDNGTFPGSSLADCSALAGDIQTCQSRGKIVTLSIGGATGAVGFESDAQATTFAETVWNLFLGGSSSTRPFGSAVLDGVDLDIEGGSSAHYEVFVNRIRSLAAGASKQYYITAAPQCVFPDAALGNVLNSANFDAIYVQFYNNPCGVNQFGSTNFNFGTWDFWARNTSPNPNVKVYLGAPASSTAGGGFVDMNTLRTIAVQMRQSFPSFGGVMLWDVSQARANGNYDAAIKNALVAAGGTGFEFPACSAPAWASGNGYPGSTEVSHNGYIYKAKWWSSAEPSGRTDADWQVLSACQGSGGGGTTTTTSGGSTPTGGGCAGVAAWSSSTIYTAGNQATYNNRLWTAKWWTQGDTPGGPADVWTDNGACFARERALVPSADAKPSPGVSSRFFRL